jgi:hypothetical protein
MLHRRHVEEALELPPNVGSVVPATPEAWAARLTELSAYGRTLSDIAAALTAERGEAPDGELATWAEATRLAVTAMSETWRCSPTPVLTPFPTIAEMADPPAGRAGDDRRPRPQCSFDDSRRSPTRPSSSSGRWTSASCSTRPASSSRSGFGSRTARWIRATTTSSPRRLASPASWRSPRGTSPRTIGSGSAAR